MPTAHKAPPARKPAGGPTSARKRADVPTPPAPRSSSPRTARKPDPATLDAIRGAARGALAVSKAVAADRAQVVAEAEELRKLRERVAELEQSLEQLLNANAYTLSAARVTARRILDKTQGRLDL